MDDRQKSRKRELKVEVYHDGEFFCARGVGEDFFTQGRSVQEVFENIGEAAALHLEACSSKHGREVSRGGRSHE